MRDRGREVAGEGREGRLSGSGRNRRLPSLPESGPVEGQRCLLGEAL